MISAIVIALASQLSLAAAPARVCVDARTGYPNFDLILTNSSNASAEISEIRGMVFGSDGTLLERRLVWQDALRASRPDTEVPANGKAVVFNPMHFNNAAPGRLMRFEIELSRAGSKPVSLDVTPVDCAQGQPRLILPVAGALRIGCWVIQPSSWPRRVAATAARSKEETLCRI